jgi:hypothetical protein
MGRLRRPERCWRLRESMPAELPSLAVFSLLARLRTVPRLARVFERVLA